jgi:hypothetical protein
MGRTPPKQHPKPFRSAVRPYVEAILSMRRHKRMTWDEIARQLQAEHGIVVHRSTVFRVYKRVRDGRDPFDTNEKPYPRSQASAEELAAACLNSTNLKHNKMPCCDKQRMTGEELLKPIAKHNSGPFAKWHEQHNQTREKTN